jgi:hypothetical protein
MASIAYSGGSWGSQETRVNQCTYAAASAWLVLIHHGNGQEVARISAWFGIKAVSRFRKCEIRQEFLLQCCTDSSFDLCWNGRLGSDCDVQVQNKLTKIKLRLFQQCKGNLSMVLERCSVSLGHQFLELLNQLIQRVNSTSKLSICPPTLALPTLVPADGVDLVVVKGMSDCNMEMFYSRVELERQFSL